MGVAEATGTLLRQHRIQLITHPAETFRMLKLHSKNSKFQTNREFE